MLENAEIIQNDGLLDLDVSENSVSTPWLIGRTAALVVLLSGSVVLSKKSKKKGETE